MEPAGRYSASPDSTTTEAANSASAASTATGGEAQQQRGESTGAATADSASGRAPDGTRSAPGAGGREPQQRPHSFSLGAIPTDQAQHRDKKRSSARTSLLAGYPEAAHRSDETGSQQVPHHQTPDSLPRPYPPQSKSFGYAPKNLARSMGSTALPRDDSTGGFAMESPMAKGDPGRAVRIDPRAPVPHGMSRSLPKQSYFPADEGEHAYYPSRSALCLHDLPQKQQYADHRYYLPPEIRKADPGGRVSSSSSFKPKRHDNRREGRYYDPFSGLIAPQNYGEADYRKQWAAYTGDQRWFYGHRCQGHHQQYAVHMVQESGRNEVFREAGDNAVLKSSGDSGGELPKYPSEQQSVNDPSSMYVYVRDAQTSTDTPVPAAVDADESPPPSNAAEMPLLGEGAAPQDEGSGSSSSSDEEEEEEEESSSESSSGSVAPENKAGDATVTLLPPEPAQQQLMAHHIQLQHQQVLQMTQQEYAEYQEAMRSYEQYQKKRQQQLHPLHPMQQQAMQQQMMIQQQLKQLQLQHQQQLQKQYQQQLQMQQQQQQEQQKLKMQQEQQQQPVDPGTGQFDKKRAVDFTGSNTSGAGEVGVRMPAEGASLRSFQSRTSGAENGSVEASGEDSRSLLSSSTNMGTPLLRPLLPERATRTATKDKMEHLCLAVNVILFSVLAGVVAAFIVQQVTHAI